MEKSTGEDAGTGEVHGHIGFQPMKAGDVSFTGAPTPEPEGGISGGGTAEQAKQRAAEIADQAHDRVQARSGNAHGPFGDVRGRAEEMVSQARDRAGSLLSRAGTKLESTSVVDRARENPLAAVGIAFAIGFLLAGSSDTSGRFGKARQQLRGAIIGGITTAIAQEARNILGTEGGAGSLLGSLFGDQHGGGTGAGRA